MGAGGRFAGRVVFITGASSGIGEALARAFAAEGADLALLARRTDRLAALAEALRGQGRRALALECDVTKQGDLEQAAERTRAELGGIDVVVANAGFAVMGRLERLTLEDYRRQFETNVFGVLRTIQATLADLKRSGGILVLIGSVSGHVSLPGTTAYSMSKFAVRGLAQALRAELAQDGVRTVLISPGWVKTEINIVDNRGVRHPEAASQGVPGYLRMPADRAARQIVRAVARKRREKVITRVGKAAVFVERHAPWLMSALVARARVRGRKEPSGAS
jgi:NAD(P)-dependent dehydrogenase (short-subunit alcohol dehydrogenase family)